MLLQHLFQLIELYLGYCLVVAPACSSAVRFRSMLAITLKEVTELIQVILENHCPLSFHLDQIVCVMDINLTVTFIRIVISLGMAATFVALGTVDVSIVEDNPSFIEDDLSLNKPLSFPASTCHPSANQVCDIRNDSDI
jgi:hypothetical protein